MPFAPLQYRFGSGLAALRWARGCPAPRAASGLIFAFAFAVACPLATHRHTYARPSWMDLLSRAYRSAKTLSSSLTSVLASTHNIDLAPGMWEACNAPGPFQQSGLARGDSVRGAIFFAHYKFAMRCFNISIPRLTQGTANILSRALRARSF